jgi:type IV secretory pathway TraG/TraD family ATPase VirD4
MKRFAALIKAMAIGIFAAYVVSHYYIAAPMAFSAKLGSNIGVPGKFCLYSPLVVFQWYKALVVDDDLYNHYHGDYLFFIPAISFLLAALLFTTLNRTQAKAKPPKIDKLRGMAREDDLKAFSKLAHKATPPKERGIFIHPNVPLPYSAESEGIAILGGTGSGKTKSCVNLIVKQAWDRGEKLIVLDSKGDFTAAFAHEKSVHILAPWDNRSIQLDLCADMPRGALDADMIGQALLPPIPNDHQPVFRNTALNIFTGVLNSLYQDSLKYPDKPLTWATLFETISDMKKLVPALQAYPSGVQGLTAIQAGPDEAAKFLTNLHSSTKFLYYLGKAWPNPSFSLRSWMRDGKGGMLILRFASDFKELSRSLCAMVTAITIGELLSWPVNKEIPVWFVLDEIANLEMKIANLAEGITAGRERGGRFVLATQDMTRIFGIYGHEEGRSILNSLRTFVAFWAGDKTNAEYAADCLGAEQEQRLQTFSDGTSSNSARAFDSSVSHNESVHLRMSKLVTPSELGELKKGEAFLRVPGLPITRLKWPMTTFEAKNPHEQIASWVHASEERLSPSPNKKPAPDSEGEGGSSLTPMIHV